MAKYKILHVGSFIGNIGDNANHEGFYKKLDSLLGLEYIVTKYEIRETFWGTKSFDEDFVSLANKHDLVVFGGGNFFELWVEKSKTGCSIDIELPLLEEIKKPIFFNALGVDIGLGVTDTTVRRFREFIDCLCQRDGTLLSIRNDGAKDAITTYLGEGYSKEFSVIPDAGMFYLDNMDNYSDSVNKSTCIIQIAGDMLELRFPDGDSSVQNFYRGMGKFNTELANRFDEIIYVPHIFRDLEVISKVLDNTKDITRRKKITVLGCAQGDQAARNAFELYKKANKIFGMRFHANVVPYGINKDVVGLSNFIQIEKFYDEIGVGNKVRVNQSGFYDKLLKSIEYNCDFSESIAKNTTIYDTFISKKLSRLL